MKVRAHITMVMNLDKCIGCHTCSVSCKNVWTNRRGAEYMWFNNVETRPGVGYPKLWEDQEKNRGGWEINKRTGKLQLKAGGKLQKLANIFFNPDMPALEDYYEPWSYDYETLHNSPHVEHQPVAQPHSQITGKRGPIVGGPNWDDDLAGGPESAINDPNLRGELEETVRMEYERVFMMYLPRICNHCVNASCMASCPSGSIYKREEDGIVLVDQDKCRGWRMCISGCPYKKMFFNWKTGKAEKCTLCYPRIESGLPTLCAETCVGRIRYIGVVLYDADRIEEVASVPDEKDLIDYQLSMILDPDDPEVQKAAAESGVPHDWIVAAQKSPTYDLMKRQRVALPLHPEYRTLPMVWYVPPLSPLMGTLEGDGADADPDEVFPAIDNMRIPIEYLASLFTVGDTDRIRSILRKLAAMRSWMREKNMIDDDENREVDMAGMEASEIERLYKVLAIANYKDRYVIPKSHAEIGTNPFQMQGKVVESGCSITTEDAPHGCGSAAEVPEPSDKVIGMAAGAGIVGGVEPYIAEDAPQEDDVNLSHSHDHGGGCGCGDDGGGEKKKKSNSQVSWVTFKKKEA